MVLTKLYVIEELIFTRGGHDSVETVLVLDKFLSSSGISRVTCESGKYQVLDKQWRMAEKQALPPGAARRGEDAQ